MENQQIAEMIQALHKQRRENEAEIAALRKDNEIRRRFFKEAEAKAEGLVAFNETFLYTINFLEDCIKY